MKKICCVSAIIIIVAMVLCACSNNTHTVGEDASMSAEIMSGADFVIGYSEMNEKTTAPENEEEATNSEFVSNIAIGEAYLSAVKDDYESEQHAVFNGDEVSLYFACRSAYDYNKRYIVFVNGVIQDADLYKAGKYLGKADDCIIETLEHEICELEFRFTPNTGHKGETCFVEICSVPYPDYYLVPGGYMNNKKFMDFTAIPNFIFLSPEEFIKMDMNAEPSASTEICSSYSDISEGKIFDDTAAFFDGAQDDSWKNENNIDYVINGVIGQYYEVNAGENVDVTLKVFGAKQNYNVCFELNGELLAPFDGCEYINIQVEEGTEKDIHFTVPAEKLGKMNNLIMYYSLPVTGDALPYNEMSRSTIYVK